MASHLKRKDIQMTNKYMNSFSTSPIIWEKKIFKRCKIALQTDKQGYKLKHCPYRVFERIWSIWNYHTLLGGLGTHATILENSLVVLTNYKHTHIWTQQFHSKKCTIHAQKMYTYKQEYSKQHYSHQTLKTTQEFTNCRMNI